MKILTIVISVILLLSIGVVFAIGNTNNNGQTNVDNKIVHAQKQESGKTNVPNPVPGNIFEGNYLRIGINDAGTLGVSNDAGDDPGVGFQSISDIPFQFPSTESAAIWWWGEGYDLAYTKSDGSDNIMYYQPGDGYPPPWWSNVQLVSSNVITDDDKKAIKEVVVKSTDNNLMLTFRYTFLKQYPQLTLETTIKNIGTSPINNMLYKRVIDWDVCADTWNKWVSTSLDSAAWGYCGALERDIQVSMSGRDLLSLMQDKRLDISSSSTGLTVLVDLNAWDDYWIRDPGYVVQSYVPIEGDYNSGIYYDIGDLKPNTGKTVYTIYQSNFPKIY